MKRSKKKIFRGSKKGVPTTVRFEIGQVEKAIECGLNISEVCRQALTEELKKWRKLL